MFLSQDTYIFPQFISQASFVLGVLRRSNLFVVIAYCFVTLGLDFIHIHFELLYENMINQFALECQFLITDKKKKESLNKIESKILKLNRS